MRDNSIFGWLRALFSRESAAENDDNGQSGTNQPVLPQHITQGIMAAQPTQSNSYVGTTTTVKLVFGWLRARFGKKKTANNDGSVGQSGTAGTAATMTKMMNDNYFFPWLNALFDRAKAAGHGYKTSSLVIHHTTHDTFRQLTQNGNGACIITFDEMAENTDAQEFSAFFVNLPLEVRRKIYQEIWGMYLKPRRVAPGTQGSDLRLHIYMPNVHIKSRLVHTRCVLHPGEPVERDGYAAMPWPYDAMSVAQPEPTQERPHWVFLAWGLRSSFGKHWRCQQAIQQRWVPLVGGGCADVPEDKAPFLPVFLTCKKMLVLFLVSFSLTQDWLANMTDARYFEAALSFFETVTLVFTSSQVTDIFFNRHHPRSPFLAHLRNIELNMAHGTDHIALAGWSQIPPAVTPRFASRRQWRPRRSS